MADSPLTEGERWSRALLADLRADGYRARAWVDFMARSLERSRATRRSRVALARQARRWGICGAAATALAARAGGLRVRASVAWWGSCWAMLDWHLGMVEGPEGESRHRLTKADALTLLRLGLVPFVAAPRSRSRWAAVVALGATTDAGDGLLARRAGTTRLGRTLDSAADGAFFSAATWGCARAGWIGRGAAFASLARHAGGLGLAAYRSFADASLPGNGASTRWAAPPTTAALILAAGGARTTASRTLSVASAAALATQAVSVRRTR